MLSSGQHLVTNTATKPDGLGTVIELKITTEKHPHYRIIEF